MGWLILAVVLSHSPLVQGQDPPPAYPRPGAVKMLENDEVIVWDIAWLEQEYPLHRHRYDHVGVYYVSGDRVIISPEGERRPITTDAWNISFQLRGVTHSEEGASEQPLRAVFVQMKREREAPLEVAGGSPTFPVGDPVERLDNDRVHVWEYGAAPGLERVLHRHAHDAVIVTFDEMNRPQVQYLQAGTEHATETRDGATRTLVFEIR